jgi:hypothetical protein
VEREGEISISPSPAHPSGICSSRRPGRSGRSPRAKFRHQRRCAATLITPITMNMIGISGQNDSCRRWPICFCNPKFRAIANPLNAARGEAIFSKFKMVKLRRLKRSCADRVGNLHNLAASSNWCADETRSRAVALFGRIRMVSAAGRIDGGVKSNGQQAAALN